MVIERIKINNFGKISNKPIELSEGINILYGENESGKTTLHTFIKSMFYGLARQRGKSAKNDSYSTYEPWENPTTYGGIMWIRCSGKLFRLSRNFHKMNCFEELVCEDDHECLDISAGDLDAIMGGVSEAVYDNTVSVGQLKSVTGGELVRELQNYMASYQGTGDNSLNLGRAMQMLKMSRKGFQVQENKKGKAVETEKEKLSSNMQFMYREVEDLRGQCADLDEQERALLVGVDESESLAIFDQRIDLAKKRWNRTAAILLGIFLLGILGSGLMLVLGMGLLSSLPIIASLLVTLAGSSILSSINKEIRRRTIRRDKWIAKREKMKWTQGNMKQSLKEKETAYQNLVSEYQEYEQNEQGANVSRDIAAINLAMETIEQLSANRNHQVGENLRRRTSQILGEITGGKYREVLMDQEFQMQVNTSERTIPLSRLSRGTLEQIYFALRMAVGELLCEEPFPIILDDVFGMYDEERLASVLYWLYKEQKQVIISTCHKREEEILLANNIPFQRIDLT
ncbi:MAG: AAA family ATPase [Eubacteriales bacterium]|nr:AAA family ATPase [Eubacteriales bacterium]